MPLLRWVFRHTASSLPQSPFFLVILATCLQGLVGALKCSTQLLFSRVYLYTWIGTINTPKHIAYPDANAGPHFDADPTTYSNA